MSGEVAPRVRVKSKAGNTNDEHIRLMAYDFRLAGYPYRAIPPLLPLNPVTGRPYTHAIVQRWVTELIEEKRAEPREALRIMEAERLDAYMLSLHKKWADTNDPRYMALLLDVQQRRARLLGLDAPTVVDTNVTIEQREDAELGDLIEQARRKAQEARSAAESAQTEQGVPGT
jgi:hypothetical protein